MSAGGHALLDERNMTDAQRECVGLLCRVFRGRHHVPARIYTCGRGIKCNVRAGLSTVDFDYLTRLVVLAHDMCIRVEIVSSGPGRVGVVLHKRQRYGDIYERHPTIEDAIEKVREAER